MKRRDAWRYIPLGLWTLFTAFPIYWVAITAFKNNASIYSGARWLPFVDYKPNLGAWHDIIGGSNSVKSACFDLSSPRITGITIWLYGIHMRGEYQGFLNLA